MENILPRREARENAFLLAFSQTFGDVPLQEALDTNNECGEERPVDVFGQRLLSAYYSHSAEVDDLIRDHLRNWTMERLPRVSLTVLRLALAEMLYGDERKPGVVINEAVELTKKYGADEDYQFVNGLLGAVAREQGLDTEPEMSLFIDLGTNGELAFGNSDFMVSCACSAGPAFEGGDISCGMRATDGAIEKCTIDPETMEPSYHVIGDEGTKPIGLCGSGIIDVIAALFRAKMVNPKGKFIREGRRIRHDKYGMGSYVIAFEEEAGSVRDVEITEVDIDNFIRAKGAIFSAIRTMLNYLDMDVSMIEEVYVAGGIGSGINMKNAVTIGMFPDIPLEKFHYIGNSSLTGAYSMLLSTAAEKKTYEVARNMTYLELSTVPTYMDEFVAACFLPHTDTTMFPSVEA